MKLTNLLQEYGSGQRSFQKAHYGLPILDLLQYSFHDVLLMQFMPRSDLNF